MKYLRFISPKFSALRQNPNLNFLGLIQSSNAISTRNHSNTPAQDSTPKPPPPAAAKVAAIANEISNLTLLEVADLTSLLGKKLDVKDLPIVSLMMPGMGFSLRRMGGAGGGAAAAPAEEEKKEKTVFDLKLEAGFEAGVKIKIIKEVRSFTDFGLKEAKELVEKAPAVLKTGVSKEDAEKIIEKMKAIGAKVIME